jgi:hypothetical protein
MKLEMWSANIILYYFVCWLAVFLASPRKLSPLPLPLSPPESLLAMITISIEIDFTTLYMGGLGTRAEPLGEGAQAGKGEGKERRES